MVVNMKIAVLWDMKFTGPKICNDVLEQPAASILCVEVWLSLKMDTAVFSVVLVNMYW
jgi:hypothetical protein